MSDPLAWQNATPLTGNLPEVYRENEVSGWLSTPWDRFLFSLKTKIDTVAQRQLNPETCDESWLDYLAALSGFTGEYWNSTWDVSIKRELIKNGLSYLWPRRGTREFLVYILELFFGNRFDVWTESEFRADVTVLPGDLGEPEYRYFIRLPIDFAKTSAEFKLARQINRLYGAFYCDSDVVYDGFYASFSSAGDPIFDEGDYIGGAIEE
jgi:phage tail P2-like protein